MKFENIRTLAARFTARHIIPCAIVMGVALAAAGWSETEYAFVVTTDFYSAAYYSTVEVLPPRTTDLNIGTVSTDPVVHYDVNEDMVFVINRYLADNIQIVDPQSGFATVGQYSVGNGSNPHDIRLATSTKAYVSRFEWKTMLIVDPYSGDSLGVIDLSVFADSDGIPEMDRMEIVGNRLFVALNCIDHTTWLPAGPGKVAVIDIEADTLVDCDPDVPGLQPIVLPFPNPYSELRYDACWGKLIVGCVGAWGDLTGGVVAIDPVTLTADTVATESELGGDISDVLLIPQGKGYAVVLDTLPWPDNYARLVAFDPVAGQVTDTLYAQTSGTGSSLATIEANRQGEVYLCDRDLTQPGLRIYDVRSDTLITKIDVGLPPFDLEFIQVPWAQVEVPSRGGEGDLLVQPNPAGAVTHILLRGTELSGPASLKIYDVEGRLIRNLVADVARGKACISWDLTDNPGSAVSPGIYYATLIGDGYQVTRPIVVLR